MEAKGQIMSDKLSEIRATIWHLQSLADENPRPSDIVMTLGILLDIVAELERIEAEAAKKYTQPGFTLDMDALHAFRLRQAAGLAAMSPIDAPEPSKPLQGPIPAQGGPSEKEGQ
jgi:hypothetical protein